MINFYKKKYKKHKKINKERKKNGDKLSIKMPTTSSVYVSSTVSSINIKFVLIEICIFKQITRKYL